MREPIRLLTVLAVLMGGLFGLKALTFANGASDWWSAHAATLEAAASQEDEADSEGEAPLMPETGLDAEPEAEAVEPAPTEAFAERMATGVRTAEEERVIYRLRERSEQLDSREEQLETREALMLAMEQRVDAKIAELNTLRDQIIELTDSLTERESEDMQVIVAWYAAMDARDAAERIAGLDMDTQIQIASRMSQRTFGPILAEMGTDAAARLTERMATRSNLPETVAELEARIAEGG